MRKNIIISFFTLLIISACSKDDTTAPVITINGTNPYVLLWGSDSTYLDPGAIATDDFDGEITCEVSGSVDMFSAGVYTITYSATDVAENSISAPRTVIIDAAAVLAGNFSIENYIGVEYDTTYNDTIYVTDSDYNKISFKHFAGIKNAEVYANISGTSISIPEQNVFCGEPAENKTFSGTGTFSNDTAFTINYFVDVNGFMYSGYGNYSKN